MTGAAEKIEEEIDEKKDEEQTPEDRGDEVESSKPAAGKDEESKVTDDDKKVAKGEEEKDAEKDDDTKATDDKKAEDDDKGSKDDKDKDVKADKNKGIKVPKFRMDAANARAKAAEARNVQLEADLAAIKGKGAEDKDAKTPEETRDEAQAEIDTKIADAMKDGDQKAVADLMAQSRTIERDYNTQAMEASASHTTTTATAEVQEATRLDAVLSQLETEYPIFDENSDMFNQEANDAVLNLQEAFIAKGDSSSDALILAVNYVLPTLGYSVEEESKDGDKDEKPEDKEVKDKKKTDVDKNLDTEKRQPANMDSAGEDGDSDGQTDENADARNLTDAEFDALPEATKKAMRGDLV